MTDYYRDLAVDYDWLYDDDALADGSAITRPAVADLLRRAGPGCAVLDAACGTGVDAAALSRRGFHVRATDGSGAMVEAAATRFRREGLAIQVQQCLWADLPDAIDERFDVVLCTGNARRFGPARWIAPGQTRAAYSIEWNGQARCSHAQTAW